MRVYLISAIVFLGSFARGQVLNGTSWILTEVYDESNQNILIDTLKKAALAFTTDSTYKGGGLCNGYFGNYLANSKGGVAMKSPSHTKKFCSGGYSDLESNLFSWYSKTNHYTLGGDQLYLYTDKLKLVFRKDRRP